MRRALIVAAFAIAAVFFVSDFKAIADGISTFGITACSTSAACIGGANTGTGAGVSGTSTKSNGVVGSTTFKSTSNTNAKSGVIGKDLSTTGVYDNGVYGTSNLGIGVLGNTTKGFGGVYGQTFNPSATTQTVTSGVVGKDASSDGGTLNVGVYGESSAGDGVFGGSTTGTGIRAAGLIALILTPVSTSTQDLMDGFSTGTFANTSRLDSDGNLHLSGEVYTDGSCSAGCARVKLKTGKQLVAYHPRAATPTIEDFGTGQMVAGRATITLDPSFAATLDARRPYLVFVTPHGDSHGLYIARETASAFDVRDSQNGRSTLDFDYRIVGKPVDSDATRLPEYHQIPVGPAKVGPLAAVHGP